MSNTTIYKIHESGRPTKHSQMQIRKELRTYYEHGIDPIPTSTDLGINIKTVYKYYNKWLDEDQEIEKKEFLQRHKRERERVVLSYDRLLVDVHRYIDNIDKLIESSISQNIVIPRHLLSLRLDSMKLVAGLIERKSNHQLSKDYIRDKKEEQTALLINETSEDRIRKIVTYLIFNDKKDVIHTQRTLLYEIIKFEGCDETQANIVFEKMVQLGLKDCFVGHDSEDSYAEKYDITRFGIMRGFVTRNEILRYLKSKSKDGLINGVVEA
jgi:hypothetical protein